MTRILTHLQRDIISCLVAENEGAELPADNAGYILRAFEGGFSPFMPFTLFMPLATKVILYVAEKGANESADKRSEFNKRCEALKKLLISTASFLIDLADHDYLRVIAKHNTVEPPPNFGAHWRRYEAFYSSELAPLCFVCSNWLIPRMKLYRLAKNGEAQTWQLQKTS
jgi:hypothetical protein